jgi:hypothetical protein
MSYDPGANVGSLPRANTGGDALHRPVSMLAPVDRDGAMGCQAAELDVWEGEGGTTAGHVPEVRRRYGERHFDELSG